MTRWYGLKTTACPKEQKNNNFWGYVDYFVLLIKENVWTRLFFLILLPYSILNLVYNTAKVTKLMEDSSAEKPPQFGNRFLENVDQVFKHNAWYRI